MPTLTLPSVPIVPSAHFPLQPRQPRTPTAAGVAPLAGPRLSVYQQDCTAGLAALPLHSVGIVITSPPYGIGTQYHLHRDDQPEDEYLTELGWVARLLRRVLHPEGHLFLNLGGRPSDPLKPLRTLAAFQPHFVVQNVLHWIKSISLPVESPQYDPDGLYSGVAQQVRTFGHFKPINSPRFVHDSHEYLFHLTADGQRPLDRLAVGVPYEDSSNLTRGTRGKHGNRRCRGNTVFLPYPTIQNRDAERPHPATFPVALPAYCLQLAGITPESELGQLGVLDPFLGIGTTLLAAARQGLGGRGYEIDPEYFVTARQALRRELAPRWGG
jgi:site-specific DNA-methyltransferase (adenine-specific)